MKKASIKNIIILLILSLNSNTSFSFFDADSMCQVNTKAITFERTAAANAIKEDIIKLYKDQIEFENKKIQIEFDWNDANVNAYATYDEENNPLIKVTGGMASHPNLTQDGLALVICHEVGHFLAGSPKKLRGRSSKKSWSSAEGQADYYATAHCLKKLFKKIPEHQENKILLELDGITQQADQICNTSLCRRIALASYSVAYVYALVKFYSQDLSLTTPSHNHVYQTILSHPDPQCRLDTMLAGLKCQNSLEINFSTMNPDENSCLEELFKRPRCWFYPSHKH